MEHASLVAENRKNLGSRSNRRLRMAEKVPAVLYGGNEPAAHISVPLRQLQDAMRHHSRVFQLKVGGDLIQALLKAVDYDQLGDQIMHVDFYRVSAGQKVEVAVTLEFDGYPKGVAAGGEFVHVLSELEVECEVNNIPESIRIKVDHLELNQSILLKEVELPPGVTTAVHMETVVCRVVTKTVVEAAPEGAEAEAAVEPELIAKKEPTAEGEEAEEKPKEKPKEKAKEKG